MERCCALPAWRALVSPTSSFASASSMRLSRPFSAREMRNASAVVAKPLGTWRYAVRHERESAPVISPSRLSRTAREPSRPATRSCHLLAVQGARSRHAASPAPARRCGSPTIATSLMPSVLKKRTKRRGSGAAMAGERCAAEYALGTAELTWLAGPRAFPSRQLSSCGFSLASFHGGATAHCGAGGGRQTR